MQIIEDRRNLHRIPELQWNLPETAAYVRKALENLNCRVFSPVGDAVCAFFDFGAEEAIAFRADMDALPIEEKSDAAYISTHPGKMHACGHDGHTAILLELARRLDKKEKLPTMCCWSSSRRRNPPAALRSSAIPACWSSTG